MPLQDFLVHQQRASRNYVHKPREKFVGSSDDIGGEGDNYDLDGGVELRVEYMFCSRDAVHIGVKNYGIRRAADYKDCKLGHVWARKSSKLFITRANMQFLLVHQPFKVEGICRLDFYRRETVQGLRDGVSPSHTRICDQSGWGRGCALICK
ncbi:hypothetical protein PIB30_043497 [Stylosanthes scabra]|uniref:Uncharacterized protein n=1 Tax=Stylosanthes scabra TaxID=79078 RepID=A0ABU6RFK5_9FABA|nr:hypothetical protein [Stylosanthes scabra]